jgi:hypothetical protein
MRGGPMGYELRMDKATGLGRLVVEIRKGKREIRKEEKGKREKENKRN